MVAGGRQRRPHSKKKSRKRCLRPLKHVLYFSDMTHDRKKELHHQLPSEKTPLTAMPRTDKG
jgi:hypothetical protein